MDRENFRNKDQKSKYKSTTPVLDLDATENQESQKKSEISDSIFYVHDMARNEDLLKLPLNTSAYNKQDQIEYSCISFLTSNRKPDVYLGNDVLKANQYRIKLTKPEEEENLDESTVQKTNSKEAGSEIDSSAEDGNNYDKMKKMDSRYFDEKNITIRCYNCDGVGHMSRSCPFESNIICIRCQQKGHTDFDCPNVKCFRCNKIGHKSYECKMRSQDIEKCQNCSSVGHEAEDCLCEPQKIKKKKLKESVCAFCGQLGHLMCPFKTNFSVIEDYHSDEVVISDSEKSSDENFSSVILKEIERRENKGQIVDKTSPKEPKEKSSKKRYRIFSKLDNKEIRTTIFCPKCAGMHSVDDCSVQLRFNSFDKRRQIYSKSLWSERNDSKGKFDKSQLSKKQAYDDLFSSDESFSKRMNQGNKKKRKEEEDQNENEKTIYSNKKKKKQYQDDIDLLIEKEEDDEFDEDNLDYFEREYSTKNKNKYRNNNFNNSQSYQGYNNKNSSNNNYSNKNFNRDQNQYSKFRNNKHSDFTFNKIALQECESRGRLNFTFDK